MLIENDFLPHLLIAVDKHETLHEVKALLQSTYSIFEAHTKEDALKFLSSEAIDLMIVDHVHDGVLGLSLCKQIISHNRYSYLPILLLIEKEEDSEFAQNALALGITNFLHKPISFQNIQTAILVAKSHKAHVLELTTFSQKLKKLAEHDALTNLYNRYVLYDHGKKEIDKALRGNLPLSLLMIDIDRFKEVNDIYGHLVGDEVLIQLAAYILKTQRSYDLTVRFGGEEFALLLPNTTLNQAAMVAEKIRLNISQNPFMTSKGPIAISISVGVASLTPTRPQLELLLQDADQALYEAKVLGRNQIHIGNH